MQQRKRILICPLNWGLGHATRCIPIIRQLLNKNAEVIIAADGSPLELLKLEFPSLKFIPFAGYNITYPSSGNMTLKMLFSVPKILHGIKKEHNQLEQIIREQKIDIVISDNRYGCWNKNVKNIFITHQLMIKAPFGERMIHNRIQGFIRNFNECWVPDNHTDGLSGDLSHKYPLAHNTYFIGPLSRFKFKAEETSQYDLMAVISGPEPQRSIFAELVLKQLKHTRLKVLIVKGIPGRQGESQVNENITIADHLNAEEMQLMIQRSGIILSRSGYSTIMDLSALSKKAIFVPTPGQTEQEYLADHFMKNKIAFSQKQSEFDLLQALKHSENYSGFSVIPKNEILEKRIDTILS